MARLNRPSQRHFSRPRALSNRDEPEIAVIDVLKSCELISVLDMNRDGGLKPVYKFWQKLRGITDEFADEMEK